MKRKEPAFRYNYAMLLDDNELDNFINQKALEAAVFARKIFVNSDSKSALEFLNNLKVSNFKDFDIFPEIIFIDINMPMIDGFQFIERFKTIYPEKFNSTKIVMLTSSMAEIDRDRALAISKQIVFLNKPLTLEALNQL